MSSYLIAIGIADDEAGAQLRRLRTSDFSLPPNPLGSLTAKGGLVEMVEQPAPTFIPSVGSSDLQVGAEGIGMPAWPLPGAGAEDVAGYSVMAELQHEAEVAEDEAEDDAEDDAEIADDLAGLLEAHEDVSLSALRSGFVISKTHGGSCRRLHYLGFCFRIPGEHYKCFEACGDQEPESHRFGFRCKDCFPDPKLQAQREEEEDLMSDSDGSSSSSSAAASEPDE